MFSSSPEYGLTDIFKHYRHYGAGIDVYLTNNSEMLSRVDFARVLNEFETYLKTRNRFEVEPDELQRLFLGMVRYRNSQNDVKMMLKRLEGDTDSYSLHYTLTWGIGEVWPPTGDVMRQLNADKIYRLGKKSGENQDAEKLIREKAIEIIAGWKERDEVVVTLAMCE